MENITVDNCIFDNNLADFGGAISYGLIPINGTILNSRFTNNHAKNQGGAIRVYNLYMDNCEFVNNVVDEDFGGAVEIGENGIVKNSLFLNNRVALDGGAIYAYELDLINFSFENNKAKQEGPYISVMEH